MIACAARGERLSILELGAGTATKTGLLLAAAVRRQGAVAYYPIDVSASALNEAQQHLEEELPGVSVHPRVGNYTESLGEHWHEYATGKETTGRDATGTEARGEDATGKDATRKLVLYIGSSIGNFEPADATQLLTDIRAQLAPGDSILIGADQAPHPQKSLDLLLAAYNDAAGVTAAFNKNVLLRINRELGADFRPECFGHEARWNPGQSRIEMHLVSLVPQRIRLPALEMDVSFSVGETIHTENSYKFTDGRLLAILEEAGFAARQQWKDPQEWFGVYLAEAV